ncbi:SGT1 family protein [Pseudohyphozyma bogoriensis]|nr:SGT1 family protein [Pseudohyphozyma bogoriensis]
MTGESFLSYTLTFRSTPTPTLLASLNSFLAPHLSTYIFHHPPGLSLSLPSSNPLSPSLSTNSLESRSIAGKTNVTDCIDDEWFLVWLLVKLSEAFTDGDEEVVVSVEDEDGEFLLIEAAEVLPKWVTPGNATNRVWIHRGRLHLIPLSHTSPLPFSASQGEDPSFDSEEEGYLDRSVAISLVLDQSVDTPAPKEVENVVLGRLSGYPEQAASHHHRTLAYLPTEIALALEKDPGLVSEAVRAFYERDPEGMRSAGKMARFPPTSPSTAFTSPDTATPATPLSTLPPTSLQPVVLTRPLYSQLVLQKFFPPKPFEKVSWMGEAEGKIRDEEERRRGVGMKLAVGFEILYARTKAQPRVNVPGDGASAENGAEFEQWVPTPEYKAFISKLSSKGFFEGEVEGSLKWQEREAMARRSWKERERKSDEEGRESTMSFAQRVDLAIAAALAATPLLPTRIVTQLPQAELKGLEDTEEWLTLNEDEFEEILKRSGPGEEGLEEFSDDDEDDEDNDEDMEGVEGGEKKGVRMGSREERMAKRLEEMAGKVEDFVEGRGGVEGAEFDDERSDDDDSDDDEIAELSPEERKKRTDALVPDLPLSEWGQKTPFVPPPFVDDAAPTADDITDLPPLSSGHTSSEIPSAVPQSRPAKLTSENYDGASDDEESTDEEMEGQEGLNPRGTRMGGGVVDEEGEEEEPFVLGDDEAMDMGEEMDEFLKFATESLGLTEEQYRGILGEREKRGAFVPPPAKPKKTNIGPPPASTSKPAAARKPAPAATPAPAPKPVPHPLRNPNLTDFDALMEQMDVELAKSKATAATKKDEGFKPTFKKPSTPASAKPKFNTSSSSKPASSRQSANAFQGPKITTDSDSDDEDDDGDMSAMDAELASMLAGAAGGDGEGTMDYNLVKNFLESFQSQGGFGGPAGNLAGRLGFEMPKGMDMD